MSFLEFVLLLVCFIPVWAPVVIAIFARYEPVSIRIVLAAGGVFAAAYAMFAFFDYDHTSGSDLELLFIPLRAAILSFYTAFTGMFLVTALHYRVAGRLLSVPGLAASTLFAGCVGAGAFILPWVFTHPR